MQYLVAHSLEDIGDADLYDTVDKATEVAIRKHAMVIQVEVIQDYREACICCDRKVSKLDNYGEAGSVRCFPCSHLGKPGEAVPEPEVALPGPEVEPEAR